MIKIVTDFQASLPPDVIEEYNITLMPSYVIFGRQKLQEGVDFTNEEFFGRLASAKEIPVTEPPAVEQFIELYGRLLEESPAASILAIHLSGEMSEMVDRANQSLASLGNADIRVVDSRTISVAEGLMVHEAAVMAQAGSSMDDILELHPDLAAVACPFCLIMLDEAATGRGAIESMALKDIAEVMAGAV